MLTDETVLARTGYIYVSCRASVDSTSAAFSRPYTAVGEKPALHPPRLVV